MHGGAEGEPIGSARGATVPPRARTRRPVIPPPNDAPAYPADYLAWLDTPGVRHRYPTAELLREPQDPGMALGRQGNENFWYSVLIGLRPDGLFVILKYDSPKAYAPKEWRYCIVDGAEWAVAAEFATLAGLLDYLEAEAPPAGGRR